MSSHYHHIVRSWSTRTKSNTFVEIASTGVLDFFGAATIAGNDKWVAYGTLTGILVRASSNAEIQILPFSIYREQNAGSYGDITKGTLTKLGDVSVDAFIDVDHNYDFFRILVKNSTGGSKETRIVGLKIEIDFQSGSLT